MKITIEAMLEYYGEIAMHCKRERDRICVEADADKVQEQIHCFMEQRYTKVPPYSILLDGRVWNCGEQRLLHEGCRFKLMPQ